MSAAGRWAGRLRRAGGVALAPLRRSRVTLERPIFVWGPGRCGSHLLYDVLSLHPGVVTPTAPERMKKGLWGWMHHGDDTPAALRGRPAPVEGIHGIWGAAGLPERFYGPLGQDALDGIDLDRVRRAYRRLDLAWRWERFAPRRVLDKSIPYLMMLEVLDVAFPDAYHVFLVREPRAIVNSILRLMRQSQVETAGREYGEGIWGHMYPAGWEAHRDEGAVAKHCWQVAALVEQGLVWQERLGARCARVRYEALAADPRGTAGRLFTFAGLGDPGDALAAVPERLPDHAPRWPRPDEPVGERYGRDLFFRDDERNAFERLEPVRRTLGYADA
jgi:hypothetical protein